MGSRALPNEKNGIKYRTVPLETESYPSNVSLISREIAGSGPAQNEPTLITSSWGIGWKIPALMTANYCFALGIAVAHYLLFHYIDRKPADGAHPLVRQSYVATTSNILSNAFGFAIRGSMAVAFTQYLWHLLRAYSMKVSTIELLFCLRTNPVHLFKYTAYAATPSLCALAIFIWGTQVVTGFPPGAISVITSQAIHYKVMPAPSFNASFMGNGSGVEAQKFALMPIELGEDTNSFRRASIANAAYDNLLLRMTYQVMVSGEALPMPSICGVNCSYIMEFEGPYLGCEHSTSADWHNTTFYETDVGLVGNLSMNIYQASVYDPGKIAGPGPPLPNKGTYSANYYNGTTLYPLLANEAALTDSSNTSVLALSDNVKCSFQRAKYTINHQYINSVHSRSIIAEPIDKLVNLIPPTYENTISVPGIGLPKGFDFGTTPANWSDSAKAVYRDLQHCQIIDSMLYYIDGNFTGYPSPTANTMNSTTTPGFMEGIGWSNSVSGTASVPARADGIQGVIIERTRFNTAFDNLQPVADSGKPQFIVNQTTLNDQLINITMSVMMAYNQWSTQVNATVIDSVNVYSFSQPLVLILPYFITLAAALPFIILGFAALIRNGVSATDGGFMQIIATSTGSAALDRAAAGGCLGGDENAPRELRELKIRFGEFVGRGDAGVKRAGFGVDGEVKPLRKGAQYGIARWL